jgi:serine/threonine-protein kinase RsbW
VCPPPFEASLPVEVEALRGFRSDLRSWLGTVGVLDARRDEIVLATHEAVANAVEHAVEDTRVTIRGRLDDGVVTVAVENRGAWREHVERGRGRGLVLMAALMTELEIVSDGGKTVVRMLKDLADGSREPTRSL